MKAQTTAIVTILAVLGLVLASTSAITYSWWSDSEEADIEITTGYLDVVTSDVVFTDGTKAAVSYDSLNAMNSEAKIFVASDNHKVKIEYTVEFKANIDVQYKVAISANLSNATSVAIDNTFVDMSTDAPVDLQYWTPMETDDGTTKTMKYRVTSVIDFYGVSMIIPPAINSAADVISIVNDITQLGAINEAIVEGTNPSVDDIKVLGTDGNMWEMGVEFNGNIGKTTLNTVIEPIAGQGDNFKLNLSLDSGASFSSATVTIMVPNVELNEDGIVIYLGDASQPTDVDVDYIAPNSYITFTTTHFSKFLFFDGIIDSVDELRSFGSIVNSGISFAGETILLGKSLDLKNEEWTPIGTDSMPFKGTFDGNGFEIRNLKIDTPDKSYVGFFGRTVNSTLENITIVNADVNGLSRVGAIVGSGYAGTISGCNVTGVIDIHGNYQVGGISGYGYATIKDCSVNATVGTGKITGEYLQNNLEGDAVGGIIGFRAEGKMVLTDCDVKNVDISGTRKVGGIAGQIGASPVDIRIVSGCTFQGSVSTNASEDYINANISKIFVGGIIGEVTESQYMRIANCTVDAKINGYADATTGEIVGGYRNADLKLTLIVTKEVSNADELVAALEAGHDVLFTNDIKIDPANMSNAYGTTGINVQKGQTIDGAGFTLDIKGAGGTWDSGINTTGGVIKNITITGSFRGIFINHNSTHSEKVVLENVITDGTVYTISCDQGLNQELEATNCTFNGWTSFAKTLGTAKFTGCTFSEGSGYNYSRPYAPTTYIDCTFEAGHTIDNVAKIVLQNCTFGVDPISSSNVGDLVTNVNDAKVQ